MSNALERILARFEEADAVQEKTASDQSQVEKTAEARMLETVRSVSLASTEKTASAPAESPAATLEQMAKHAQESEHEVLQKDAKLLGAAVCDGFMERYAAYEEAVSRLQPKTASVNIVPGNADTQKIAADAYAQAREDMEKEAEASYEQGYRDQLGAVHKVAAEIHYAGQMVAHNIVEQYRTQK